MMANYLFIKTISHYHKIHTLFYILNQKLQYQWLLTVFTLVNIIKEFCWILQFVESMFWLSLQQIVDDFTNPLNCDNLWILDG